MIKYIGLPSNRVGQQVFDGYAVGGAERQTSRTVRKSKIPDFQLLLTISRPTTTWIQNLKSILRRMGGILEPRRNRWEAIQRGVG